MIFLAPKLLLSDSGSNQLQQSKSYLSGASNYSSGLQDCVLITKAELSENSDFSFAQAGARAVILDRVISSSCSADLFVDQQEGSNSFLILSASKTETRLLRGTGLL